MFQSHNFKKVKRKDRKPRDGFLSFDMHFHTKHSDGFASVRRALKRAEKIKIGLAITDHNTIAGVLEAAKCKPEFPLIPGIEVSSKEGPDILVYFYRLEDLKDFFEKHIKKYRGKNKIGPTKKTIYEILSAAKKYKCITVAAHPFHVFKKSWLRAFEKSVDFRVFNLLDGIETNNAATTGFRNKLSIFWALISGKCCTGGSDGHSLGALGRVLVRARASSVEEFLDAVAKRECSIQGKRISIYEFFKQGLQIAKKHIPRKVRNLLYSFAKKIRVIRSRSA